MLSAQNSPNALHAPMEPQNSTPITLWTVLVPDRRILERASVHHPSEGRSVAWLRRPSLISNETNTYVLL